MLKINIQTVLPFVLKRLTIIRYLYLFMYNGVQQDFHIT
jgi:hypothetical protein